MIGTSGNFSLLVLLPISTDWYGVIFFLKNPKLNICTNYPYLLISPSILMLNKLDIIIFHDKNVYSSISHTNKNRDSGKFSMNANFS